MTILKTQVLILVKMSDKSIDTFIKNENIKEIKYDRIADNNIDNVVRLKIGLNFRFKAELIKLQQPLERTRALNFHN